ncbi:MAG: S8 family serine peptidase [Bacteroidota bacterium]|nr:S8 family serine peptidase [Bacteroidota bacterium]
MKKYLLLFVFVASFMTGTTQIAPNKYYIQFTDKSDSPYSIDSPEEFLSQRAIDRRDRFDIAITEEDLPVNPQYISGVSATGAAILNPTKWLNGLTIYTGNPAILDDIMDLPYVEGVYLLTRGEAGKQEKEFFSNESYYPVKEEGSLITKSASLLDYGLAFNQIHMLKGEELHNMGLTGEGMVIAVLDAGFFGTDNHIAFDSLFVNGQILGTKDFVAHSGTVYDYHTHGTSVLSTMGANVPGQMIGTAPHADYYLLRTEDGASEYIVEEYNWVSGVEFADSAGADVINSSLGYTTFDDPSQDHTYADMNGNTTPITIGADIAASKGMLVVNSAGNSGSGSWYYIGAPADGNEVFSIGAVDAGGNLAGFSSRGPTADGRIKPNVCAQGAGAVVADPWGGSFTYSSGTSFSSPIIAGMSASLWQGTPDKTNLEIMQALMDNGNYAANPNNDYGWGIPNYLNAYTFLTVIEDSAPEGADIDIFPNPIAGQLNIQLPGMEFGKELNIKIFDQSGRLMMEFKKSAEDGMISLEGLGTLSKGLYLLRVYDQTGVYTTKFIK